MPITESTTATILHDALAAIGTRLILRALAEDPPAVPQPEAGATYAPKLTREDGRIDWSRDTTAILRQVRALNPWPGTYATLDGEILKIHAAAAAEGAGCPRHRARRRAHGRLRQRGGPPPARPAARPRRARCRGLPPRPRGAARHHPAVSETAADRWALLLEYDGTPFIGWQRQGSGVAVQDVLEQAAARLARGVPLATMVAGRTDAGVHAAGQVAQITLPAGYAAGPGARRAELPHEAPSGRGARRRALAPRVERPLFRPRPPLPLPHPRPPRPAGPRAATASGTCPTPWMPTPMAEGARHLLGRHDFTSFRASACQANSPLRTLDRLEVIRSGETIEIFAEARSFLHHQVRNMAGTLKLVGEGRWRPEDVAAALAARDRRAAGPTAPAAGPHPAFRGL